MQDSKGYLKEMAKPRVEKLKALKYFPNKSGKALDVGCADGVITRAMAEAKHDWEFLGIDLEEDFVHLANENSVLENLSFEKVYLRDLLPREPRYDVVTFLSVLHEFYTYGEGISSVMKAMADAHELLNTGGRIIIRDMVLNDYVANTEWKVSSIKSKIADSNKCTKQLVDFEDLYGEIKTVKDVNHFLLKYMYTENWNRELPENYVGMQIDQYESIFNLLGMKLLYKESYLIEFLKNRWQEDFGLTDEETESLRSTTILVAEKN